MGRDAALARTRGRASARSRSAPRSPSPACTPSSRTRTCPGARRTGSSTTTSRCSRSPRSATRASRWRSSPPTIRRPRAAPPTGSRSTTRSSSRWSTPSTRSIPDSPPLHPAGNLLRHVHIAHGEEPGEADVVVTGEYEVGMQDQAFLGPGVRARGARRGRRRRPLHLDPVAARRPRPGRRVARPAGGEGALHARRRGRRVRRPRGRLDADPRLPARAAHRPAGEDGLRPRGVVLRPRPPPSGADALRARRDARRQARLHQGAGSCSTAARTRPRRPPSARTPRRSRSGPYEVPSARIDAYVVYTDNPPCGAMRGFGAVQTCFAHEAQMDKLAAALELDPVELRLRNAMTTGTSMPTGAPINCPAPVARAARVRARPRPLPAERRRHARRDRQRHPRRGRRARRRLRRRLQERRLLRGLRRLLDRARAALDRRR